MTARKVRALAAVPFSIGMYALTFAVVHKDAVWGVTWTPKDEVISVSADGTVKKWNSTSAQVSLAQPAHPLAVVSLDVDAEGRHALYNTLEGLTCLWDLEKGEVLGKHESYAREAKETTEPGESCIPSHSCHPYCAGDVRDVLMPVSNRSLVCIYPSQRRHICRDGRHWQRNDSFRRPSVVRSASRGSPKWPEQIWDVLQTCGSSLSLP